MIRKWLSVGIILLFVGVTIAPSINTSIVKASQKEDLIEVNSQACGITGYKDTTVKLTREQYQNLEEYLEEFRSRLNQTSTQEEAIPVFKDAVVELNKYGLLGGLSVVKAQNLVIGHYPKVVDNIIKEKPVSSDINNNLLCLITGKGEVNGFLPITGILFMPLYGIAIFLSIISSSPLVDLYVSFVLKIFNLLGRYYNNTSTVFGADIFYLPTTINNGWVHTFGVLGNKNMSGDLEGVLPYYILGFRYFLILEGDNGRGVLGFNGIRIYTDEREAFYIGNALQVRIKVN